MAFGAAAAVAAAEVGILQGDRVTHCRKLTVSKFSQRTAQGSTGAMSQVTGNLGGGQLLARSSTTLFEAIDEEEDIASQPARH